MKDKLVADWLTKAGERGGLDVAFCQLLISQGYRILRAGHSPMEAGKDIVALGPKGHLRAYQIKQGNIDLKIFDGLLPQVTKLVEAAISHPNVRRGSAHCSFLVTTGTFSPPVESIVRELNDSWQRRGFEPLSLISGPQLVPDFVAIGANFWPEDPTDLRSFLALYLAEGKGDFDHASYAKFLRLLFPEQGVTKTIAGRRIAAANLFASYVLESFHIQRDHWSAFRGWIMTGAYELWMAEGYELQGKTWRPSFELARTAALSALKDLASET